MLRIVPDGYPFIIVFALITVLVYIFGKPWMAVLPLTITLFMALFFRDPGRTTPGDKGVFISPADGKVILIKDVYEKDYLKSESREISIFMSIFDVHVNRAPCDGTVNLVQHFPGQFLAAHKDAASIKNENTVMFLEGKDGKILVRQVAGLLARRIVCKVKAGDVLRRGERYGMIKFGSRLDVYLPKDAEIKVKLGDKVKAGETVLGLKEAN
ncbi:MAG: phosphatidylserine decarboxylase [Nitrospirae bacterium RBG_13_43_8]|nr:MAG: phosphatidylserine decarboxylase [Nitrospirae bacterium RBG_13_43_8]